MGVYIVSDLSQLHYSRYLILSDSRNIKNMGLSEIEFGIVIPPAIPLSLWTSV
jgi:hypothetical protein